MKKSHRTIFIAEDNPQYRFLLETKLQQPNTIVHGFDSGESLLENLSYNPDAIILDHHFVDGKSGLELLPLIKSRLPHTPIIFLSGQNKVEVAIQALKKGAFDYVEKGNEEIVALKRILKDIEKQGQESFMDRVKKMSQSLGLFFLLITLTLALFLQSCGNPQGFMRSKTQTPSPVLELMSFTEHRIQPDDKISVSVWNNEDLSVGSVFGIYNSNEVYGKWILVDQEGNIQLPKLGTVKLGGLTCSEAQNHLISIYSEEIVSPVVVVKVLNREVTLLGELTDPGSYLLDKEHNGLMEILGKAGGFTDYARTQNIKLVRETEEGTKEYEIDLKQLSAPNVQNIQVLAGDVIVVPTGRGKRLEKKLPLIIPLASILTGAAVLISVLPR